MILTCPSCGTQYVVKDGAVPPQGRQVRCAACKHSWHQHPEPGEAPESAGATAQAAPEPTLEDAPGARAEGGAVDQQPPVVPENPELGAGVIEPVDVPMAAAPVEPAPVAKSDSEPPAAEWPRQEEEQDEDFSPFAERDPIERQRSRAWLVIPLAILLIAAIAAAVWFLAPPSLRQRLGIAGAGETPLQLMMTHSDRQTLASGNELLAVSGRVINPTDETLSVPPIQAQLRSASGELVYSWTIAPPARTLPPGASATFNSAEVNVPAGGDELTITLGSVKT